MSEPVLANPPQDDAVLAAEAHEKRVAAELNIQFQELRDQSQALIAAVKGHQAANGPTYPWGAAARKRAVVG
jgi:hypothetical protein